MKLGIVRLACSNIGQIGYYNSQEIGLAKALLKYGIKTDIFILKNKNITKNINVIKLIEGIRIVEIPTKNIGNNSIISPRFLLNYNLDFVHLCSDNQIILPKFIKFLKNNNIKYYCYIGTIGVKSNNIIKRIVMKSVLYRNIRYYKKSYVIAKNEDVYKKLKKFNISNCNLIPVGLDLSIIYKDELKNKEFKKFLKYEDEDKIILYVGRLKEDKRPLEAFKIIDYIISKKGYNAIIIGDGELREKIESLILNSKYKDKYKYIPKIKNEDIHKYYNISDVFINTSDVEIFGMSILEAMYHGCKVFAKTAPGPNMIIKNEKDGFLINSYDEILWGNMVEENINNNKISYNSIKKINEIYNWDIISREYIKIYMKNK